ncbi:MAG: hypothetical protein M3Q99_15375 [Acidobacteriota bacterium]|nr:hypothetical protein [Acidobacteriota bacterium]
MSNKQKNEIAPVVPVAIVADPNVEAVVEPVIQTDARVPTVEVERTETQPLVEPTAIVPNIVHEINRDAVSAANAPQVLTTKGANATRVEVIYDGTLGPKALKKGDITDDAEYVRLLKTMRGRELVREVK